MSIKIYNMFLIDLQEYGVDHNTFLDDYLKPFLMKKFRKKHLDNIMSEAFYDYDRIVHEKLDRDYFTERDHIVRAINRIYNKHLFTHNKDENGNPNGIYPGNDHQMILKSYYYNGYFYFQIHGPRSDILDEVENIHGVRDYHYQNVSDDIPEDTTYEEYCSRKDVLLNVMNYGHNRTEFLLDTNGFELLYGDHLTRKNLENHYPTSYSRAKPLAKSNLINNELGENKTKDDVIELILSDDFPDKFEKEIKKIKDQFVKVPFDELSNKEIFYN